ncbi:MAG TPA: hypothetical protein VK864_17000, partial [Longimicrobiales bacterium]|nr:hypothetical protein [Longimicrobiales bacterium]
MMRAARGLAVALLLALPAGVPAQTPAYDIVLRGGTIVDGTGAAGYRADVGIRGDRIERIAREGIAASAGRTVI